MNWPSWLTYSGRLTHISGHPSAKGQAWDMESSPVKDRRSTTVPRAANLVVCTALFQQSQLLSIVDLHSQIDRSCSDQLLMPLTWTGEWRRLLLTCASASSIMFSRRAWLQDIPSWLNCPRSSQHHTGRNGALRPQFAIAWSSICSRTVLLLMSFRTRFERSPWTVLKRVVDCTHVT